MRRRWRDLTRFEPVLRTVWLVCKQHGCNRDLRTLIMNLVKSKLFRWETQALRSERFLSQDALCKNEYAWISRHMRLISSIINRVERWDEPTEDGLNVVGSLTLQRVEIALRPYSQLRHHWRYLYK